MVVWLTTSVSGGAKKVCLKKNGRDDRVVEDIQRGAPHKNVQTNVDRWPLKISALQKKKKKKRKICADAGTQTAQTLI